jgi:hypothetical protein
MLHKSDILFPRAHVLCKELPQDYIILFLCGGQCCGFTIWRESFITCAMDKVVSLILPKLKLTTISMHRQEITLENESIIDDFRHLIEGQEGDKGQAQKERETCYH